MKNKIMKVLEKHGILNLIFFGTFCHSEYLLGMTKQNKTMTTKKNS